MNVFFLGSKNPCIGDFALHFGSLGAIAFRESPNYGAFRSIWGHTRDSQSKISKRDYVTRFFLVICDSLIYSVTELTADGFAVSRSLLKTSRKRAIFYFF